MTLSAARANRARVPVLVERGVFDRNGRGVFQRVLRRGAALPQTLCTRTSSE